MKNLLFFLLSLIALCSCSGESYKVGDVIWLDEDCPSADSYYNAKDLEKYVENHNNKEAMRMFYLGHAFAMEKGHSIKILEVIDDDYYHVEYWPLKQFEHYTYKKALNRNGHLMQK